MTNIAASNKYLTIFDEGDSVGGKEGSRGYVYQGIIAVLEALTQDGWNKIFVEFPTPGDKVEDD